ETDTRQNGGSGYIDDVAERVRHGGGMVPGRPAPEHRHAPARRRHAPGGSAGRAPGRRHRGRYTLTRRVREPRARYAAGGRLGRDDPQGEWRSDGAQLAHLLRQPGTRPAAGARCRPRRLPV
ncbi:MAG: hypothetical protein AVDCRST_MAG89-2880, partial [uncultured Gemmatimonadetes bacterium]